MRLLGLLTALSLVAGMTFVFNEIAQRSVAPAAVAFSRAALGAAVLVAGAVAAGTRLPRISWRVATVAAVQVAGPFFLLGLGQTALGVGNAAIVLATVPLLTVALAPLLYAPERSGAGSWAALVLGFLGIAIAVGADPAAVGSADGRLGLAAVALAALGFAAGGLLAQRLPGPPLALSAAVMIAAALELSVPAALAVPSSRITLDATLAMAALGAIGTGGVFLGLYFLIGRFGATTAALLDYGAPASGFLYGALFFDEGLGPTRCLGIAMVVAGSVLALQRLTVSL